MIKGKDSKKISRKLNNILIDRIRKYQSQDVTQLLNSPKDEDSDNSYLGGLINFVGDDSQNLDDEINYFLDRIPIDDIHIESIPDNEYINDNIIGEKKEKDGIEILKETNEKKEDNNNENKENNSNETNDLNINIFTESKKPENSIRILLAENYNNYFDLIANSYEKYDNNHFPKIIIKDDKDNTKKIMLNNLRNKIFYTEEGKKIIINEEIYTTSLAFLKNKKIYDNIPLLFKANKEEYKLDIELLDDTIENIQKKNIEFIEINKLVSTSMSKILIFCNQLDKYIKNKLEPFNTSINTSYQKVFNKKKKIKEMKEITLKNSGNLILKKLKMNNLFKLMTKLKVYTKLKNNMNNLEKLLLDPKNYQKTLDLINKSKNDIELVQNENTIKDPILEIFLNKLIEYKNENDGYMSGELSQVLNKYFGNLIIIEPNPNEKNLEIYEQYNISKFVLEKISSFQQIHKDLLASFIFSDPKEELEKMSDICDYYIKSNLINNLYTQLRGIFLTLTENTMNDIISLFNQELTKTEEINEDKVKGEDLNVINIQNEICILLCFLVSKNKFNEIICEFIDILAKKLEKNENIDENIIKEVNYIKLLVQKNIKNKFLEQIKKCLDIISSICNLDIYINNFYLVLEMLKDEISKYENEKTEEKEENNETNNNMNSNNLYNVIMESQKKFVENITQNWISKFETEKYKSWEALKEIPQRYQNILNIFFSFDINNNCLKDEYIITEFPSEKIKLIKELEEEEEEKTNNNSDDNSDINNQLIIIKSGENPEIKIKSNQTLLEIIQQSFDILKMFTMFHKDCYGTILENFTKLILSHLDFQTEQIYNGKCGFSVSQQEICITYCIFLLLEYIYEHIKTNEFFLTVAEVCDGKISDNYLDLDNEINKCRDLSKKKLEDLIENHCVNEALNKLYEIKLPYYNVISGDVPVNEYCISYVSILKDIYESMNNCFQENFIKELMNKALDDFFDKFEDYILHGKKIEDENCLKQFKRDMVFLKKNLVFLNIIDLTEVKNRIDNINKSVLPEWLRHKKK